MTHPMCPLGKCTHGPTMPCDCRCHGAQLKEDVNDLQRDAAHEASPEVNKDADRTILVDASKMMHYGLNRPLRIANG